MRHWTSGLLCAGALAALLVFAAAAEDPKAVHTGLLVVVDASGKESKLKTWTFTLGTEHLSWLAPKDAAAPPPEKNVKGPKTVAKDGPEAFTFRELDSTGLRRGVVTLVPVERVRTVEYDMEKHTVTMRVATNDKPEDDTRIVGSTEYVGTNKITLEAEIDLGDMGVAEKKFLGGVEKGIQALRFAAPKVAAVPAGRSASVTIVESKMMGGSSVTDLQVLYRTGDGSERLSPLLYFKKTLKIDLAKIKKLSFSKENDEVTLTPKEGEEATYTLLSTVMLDGKEAELVGLVGRVPAGYRLFPPRTLKEIEFDVDAEKKPDEKKPDEKKPDNDK